MGFAIRNLPLAATRMLAAFGAVCMLAVPSASAAAPLRVSLTFDDSLKDHLLVAAPLLEERGWRGTFCIVTD